MNDFNHIYEKIVKDNEEKLENLRKTAKEEKKYNKKVKMILFGIGLILFIIAIVMIIKFIFSSSFTYIYYAIKVYIVLSIYIAVSIIVYYVKLKKSNKMNEYTYIFKTEIITAILKSFDENIEYLPKEGINSSDYDNAEFEKYDTYKSEDLMIGTLKNNCNFQMGEVLTEDEIVHDDNVYYSTLFNGMFAKIETDKTFNARFYLRNNMKNNGLITKNSEKNISFADMRVELDSTEFENYFDIYCTDKIVAMRLLTADIMQLLIKIREELDMEYEITIKDNYIFIRFMSGEMFEIPDINNFSLDEKTLYKYYKIINLCLILTYKLENLLNDFE